MGGLSAEKDDARTWILIVLSVKRNDDFLEIFDLSPPFSLDRKTLVVETEQARARRRRRLKRLMCSCLFTSTRIVFRIEGTAALSKPPALPAGRRHAC